MGLADDMVPAIRTRYGNTAAERVVDAWNRGMAGEIIRKEWEGKGSQIAASYVDGLEAEPWHNVDRYPWISSLESDAAVIRDELRSACSGGLGGRTAWVPAPEEDADAYGPGWQKLVLQNRVWDSAACDIFPKTCEILQGCGAPSNEVFFARQCASSGIKPHTDNSNFFITAHLPLEVPEGGGCWIRVGTNEKREWHENRVLAFDSSFVHETRNDAPSDRTVLLVRFWHPQLTQVERDALGFIFSALDDPSVLDQPYNSALDLKGVETSLDSMESLEPEASLPASSILDGGSGETTASDGRGPTQAAPSESLQVESRRPVSVPGDESHEHISVEPLGDAAEAERLDGFLADLKAEGLLPDAGTGEDLLDQGPKNRSERRKASKARKKAARQGKRKKR